MALENLKKTLWEEAIMENFYDASCVEEFTTAPTEVKGKKIIFNRINKGTWDNYVTGQEIVWKDVATSKVELDMDKAKSFAYVLEDIDKTQADKDVLKVVTKEQAGLLGEIIQKELITIANTGVKSENIIANTDSKIKITNANVYDTIVDLSVCLSQNKVPMNNRFAFISHKVLGMLEKDERFTRQYSILENGIVEGATVNGVTLVVGAENPQDKITLLHKSALGYGMQIDEVEGMRLQNVFGDGVRGLVSYGYTVLRSECITLANITV